MDKTFDEWETAHFAGTCIYKGNLANGVPDLFISRTATASL